MKDPYDAWRDQQAREYAVSIEAMIVPLPPLTDEQLLGLEEWSKDQCSRLLHGQCSTRRCLMRGGYPGRGEVDCGMATCEPFEVSQLLAAARWHRDALRRCNEHAEADEKDIERLHAELATVRAETERLRGMIREYLGEHDTPAKDFGYRARCRENLRAALAPEGKVGGE